MGYRIPGALSRAPACLQCVTRSRRAFESPITLRNVRNSSTEPAPPPLLTKLRGDLKSAMKAKDTARLNVLRAVIASTLNASKTASPIKTDTQMVALLRKQLAASKEAADEFATAGRADLAEKEESQAAILADYVHDSGFRELTQEELKDIILRIKGDVAAAGVAPEQTVNETLKRLMAADGPLQGTTADKKEVAKLVRQLT